MAAQNQPNQQNDGLTAETAIPVNNIFAEYQYLRATYPGHRVRQQALLAGGFDRISITTADGRNLDIYFDIKSFFPRAGVIQAFSRME